MKSPKATGTLGEQLAATFLEKRGYDILERNWRRGKLEVDIIARLEDMLVIVEVKTRSNLSYGMPEAFVTTAKWYNLARAAGKYMEKYGFDWEVRFDIISVALLPDGRSDIRHFEDVWFPRG